MSDYIKTFEVKKHYLLIEAHGIRKNLLEVVEGTSQFVEIIQETKSNKVLLDYRHVTFNVNVSDAYNIVRYYEKLPALGEVKIAALINEQTLTLARAWKDISLKRGFSLDYFLEFEKAEQWLISI